MKHIHKYEPVLHPTPSADAMSIGIKAVEIRRCQACQKEATFIQTKQNQWIPLFRDEEADEQDILLA